MERLKAWWRSRREARVSTDDTLLPQSVAQALTILVGLCVVIVFVWAIFLGGRWAYRSVFGSNDKQIDQSQQSDNKPAETENSQPAKEDTAIPEGAFDSPDQQATESTPSPTPAPQTTAPPAQEVPRLPRSGPEE